tara:strand:- start:1248 stop:1661 length:414 start_codon:yes stop_codon:yes gene_type:complete
MNNIFLVLFLSFGLLNLSLAGGDDRDQQLPLNSLNTEQEIDEDAAPRFLQEDEEVVQDAETLQGQKEIEELIQTKLANNSTSEDNTSELESNLGLFSSEKVQLFIDQYVKSDQGILILLILFVVLLILVFNFFVREK